MRHITRSLLVLALAASLAPAAHAADIIGIDAMTSTVMQQEQSSFSGLGVRARVHSTRFIENIEFMPFFEYWRNTSTVRPFDIRSSRSDGTVGFDARYRAEFRGVHPYAGAGYGIHFLSSEVQAPSLGFPFGRNSLVKGGLSFLGGASFPLVGRLENFIEVKYHHVPDYGQVKINMGLGFGLR